MKINDIVTLLKAGYSKAEISELSKQPEESSEVSESTVAPDLTSKMSEIVNKMNEIEARLNSDNIDKTEVNEISNIDPAEVLAGMIR